MEELMQINKLSIHVEGDVIEIKITKSVDVTPQSELLKKYLTIALQDIISQAQITQ